MQQREAENQSSCPDAEQHQQGQRTIVSEKRLSAFSCGHLPQERREGNPGSTIEGSADAETSSDSSRQDDRLKGVPPDAEDQPEPCYQPQCFHLESRAAANTQIRLALRCEFSEPLGEFLP